MVHNSLQKITKHERLIMETNTDIPVEGAAGTHVLRANIFRPLDTEDGARYPALMTLGPYGKDVHYRDFRPEGYADISAEHQSEFSAWETPDPVYWTAQGYVVIRVDERGTGQSPGVLDIFSGQTTVDVAACVEWAAGQTWCTGRVGLMGVSYYAIVQWGAAARRPKGLACIIPWEGATDIYRDCARQGGIFGNKFFEWWYKRQVASNQYGLPGKAARNWGPDTIECALSEAELRANEVHIYDAALGSQYVDDAYFASRVVDLEEIDVPLLSVANWGGITLHLRGNVMGYMEASSKNKWLYFLTGRHDIPFYLPEYVDLQKSFLAAWLKDDDDRGWRKGPNAPGGVPAVSLLLRAGNPGYNSTPAERTFKRRDEAAWPIPRTTYTTYHLHADKTLAPLVPAAAAARLKYRGLDGEPLQFTTAPFQEQTEFTGHVVANLLVALEAGDSGQVPTDMDLFLTLRHLDAAGSEIFYTGTAGDPAPLCKGWLRASLRTVDPTHPRHRPYLPHRPYTRALAEHAHPTLGEPFLARVEMWPTNVVVAPGNRLVFEVSPRGTQGDGVFGSNHPQDRCAAVFAGTNILFVGPNQSWVELPCIPSADADA